MKEIVSKESLGELVTRWLDEAIEADTEKPDRDPEHVAQWLSELRDFERFEHAEIVGEVRAWQERESIRENVNALFATSDKGRVQVCAAVHGVKQVVTIPSHTVNVDSSAFSPSEET